MCIVANVCWHQCTTSLAAVDECTFCNELHINNDGCYYRDKCDRICFPHITDNNWLNRKYKWYSHSNLHGNLEIKWDSVDNLISSPFSMTINNSREGPIGRQRSGHKHSQCTRLHAAWNKVTLAIRSRQGILYSAACVYHIQVWKLLPIFALPGERREEGTAWTLEHVKHKYTL